MTTPISVAEAKDRIVAEPAPVLFLDTCTLLDVLRVASERETKPHLLIPAAENVRTKSSSSPRKMWLLAAERFDVEWTDNAGKVLGRIEEYITRVDRSLVALHAATRAVSLIPSSGGGSDSRYVTAGSAPQVGPFGLPKRLTEICERILRILIRVSPDADVLGAAERRSIAGLKPAAIGKREHSDCLIIETCFALCKSLREHGFAEQCAFVSSNKADFYGEGKPLRPHEDLAVECSTINLQFAVALDHALSILYA